MIVHIHPHALDRLEERGASQAEVEETVQLGESRPAKRGRMAFRRNFAYNAEWRGKKYAIKQVLAVAVKEGRGWLVITVVTKFF